MQNEKQLKKDAKPIVKSDAFYRYNSSILPEVAEDNFLTAAKFSETIERIVKDSEGLVNYIDAIITYCEENQIEYETVVKLISKPLKDKLKYDAQRLNFIKKTTMGVLPIL